MKLDEIYCRALDDVYDAWKALQDNTLEQDGWHLLGHLATEDDSIMVTGA